jgi:hypothetical protein
MKLRRWQNQIASSLPATSRVHGTDSQSKTEKPLVSYRGSMTRRTLLRPPVDGEIFLLTSPFIEPLALPETILCAPVFGSRAQRACGPEPLRSALLHTEGFVETELVPAGLRLRHRFIQSRRGRREGPAWFDRSRQDFSHDAQWPFFPEPRSFRTRRGLGGTCRGRDRQRSGGWP